MSRVTDCGVVISLPNSTPPIEPSETAPEPIGTRLSPAALVSMVKTTLRGKGMGGALARGSLSSFAVNVVGTCCSFAVQIILARALGAKSYGAYAYTLGWMNIVLLVAKFEFDTTSLRFMGAYRGQRAWSLMRGFVERSYEIVGSLSLAVAVVAAIGVWLFRGAIPQTLVLSYLVGCALLPATALLTLTASALQGLQRVVQAQAPNLVLRPVLFGLGVGVAWFFWRDQLDTPLALGLNLLATCIVLVLSTRYLRSALPPEARGVRAEFDTKEWWRVAAGFLVISASQVILSQQSDVVVVGTMVTTTAAGQYGAASQLSALVNFGVTAVLFMATPMIAELFAQGNRGQLQRLIVLVARSNAAISIPVWLLLAVAGRFLLSWYGHAFVEAYPVLVILATSQLIVALVGSLAGFILSMTGHQNAAAVIIGVSAALNLGLTIILTPMFGLVGTATATLIGTLVRSIALIVYIKRVLHIDLMPFGLSPRRSRG